MESLPKPADLNARGLGASSAACWLMAFILAAMAVGFVLGSGWWLAPALFGLYALVFAVTAAFLLLVANANRVADGQGVRPRDRRQAFWKQRRHFSLALAASSLGYVGVVLALGPGWPASHSWLLLGGALVVLLGPAFVLSLSKAKGPGAGG